MAAPSGGGVMAAAYRALLRSQRGVVSGVIYAGEDEIGRIPETTREPAIEIAREIVRDHRDGWIVTETLDLDDAGG